MIRLASLPFVSAVGVLLTFGPAWSQENLMLGTWQQVQSNAGECQSCQVRLAREDDHLSVTANNGWAGRIHLETESTVLAASGIGRWKPTAGEPRAGKFFRIYLAIVGARLYVELTGSQRDVVKAVFVRISPVGL